MTWVLVTAWVCSVGLRNSVAFFLSRNPRTVAGDLHDVDDLHRGARRDRHRRGPTPRPLGVPRAERRRDRHRPCGLLRHSPDRGVPDSGGAALRSAPIRPPQWHPGVLERGGGRDHGVVRTLRWPVGQRCAHRQARHLRAVHLRRARPRARSGFGPVVHRGRWRATCSATAPSSRSRGSGSWARPSSTSSSCQP